MGELQNTLQFETQAMRLSHLLRLQMVTCTAALLKPSIILHEIFFNALSIWRDYPWVIQAKGPHLLRVNRVWRIIEFVLKIETLLTKLN